MISAMWLLVIIPEAIFVGMFLAALLIINERER